MKAFRLDGKQALVTGAGRGIGRACALTLAAAGAEVTAVSRTRDELDVLAAEIGAAGGVCHVLTCDCADTGQITDKLGNADAVWDVLVNNAGTNRPQPFHEVSEENYDQVMQVNVKGAFFVAQAVARKLIAAGKPGSIIHMSSQMGHVGGATRSVYCASKHAIEGLTKAMAVDLAAYKIRVNTVCPTFVLTPMTEPFFQDPAFKQDVLNRILLGDVATMDDVAHAVLYLAADASRMVTGSALKVDGGWTAV